MIKNLIKKYLRKLYNASAYETECKLSSIYWGQIYNSTIEDSKWLSNRSVSPGRWAVGYEYLYVLYRTLNEVKPRSVLELGLGVSTRIISQYAKYAKADHVVVEHDPLWANFFRNGWEELSEYTNICVLPLKEFGSGNNKYFGYQDFDKCVQEKSFDVISVDGPFGGEGVFSRRDILPLLPKILNKDFIIMFDDCGRIGEQKTVKDVEAILNENGILYKKGIYNGGGTKITTVLASESWKFLCSL